MGIKEFLTKLCSELLLIWLWLGFHKLWGFLFVLLEVWDYPFDRNSQFRFHIRYDMIINISGTLLLVQSSKFFPGDTR